MDHNNNEDDGDPSVEAFMDNHDNLEQTQEEFEAARDICLERCMGAFNDISEVLQALILRIENDHGAYHASASYKLVSEKLCLMLVAGLFATGLDDDDVDDIIVNARAQYYTVMDEPEDPLEAGMDRLQ